MAPPKLYSEAVNARFAPGTLAAIRAALAPDEAIADFLRTAVSAELGTRHANGQLSRGGEDAVRQQGMDERLPPGT